MRRNGRNISSSLKKKFEALQRCDSSMDELEDDIGLSSDEEQEANGQSWYKESIFSSHGRTIMDPPSNFTSFFTNLPTSGEVGNRQSRRRTADVSSTYTRGWMNKWKNRTQVTFCCCTKQFLNSLGRKANETVEDTMRHVATPVDSTQYRGKFTGGLDTLLLALQYVENRDDKLAQLSAIERASKDK